MLTSVVKWSEGLSNRVSMIIIRYIDHRKLAAYMVVSSITFFHMLLVLFYIIVYIYIYIYIYTVLNYVFLLLCMFRSRHSVSLCCSV